MKLWCFGDSNTYGYDPCGFFGGRYDAPWPELLAEKTGFQVINDGKNGRMIPEREYEFVQFLRDAERQSADVLIVMLGTNDLLSMRHPDAAEVAEKMDNLIGSASEGLSAEILLIAPPRIRFTDPSCTQPFVQGTETYERECLEQSALLARYYGEIAARRGAFYADASSWDLKLAFDGVHLSEEGNAVFAKELEKVIRRI